MIAYFDCLCGISGDMTLAALIDLGVPVKFITERLRSIPLEGFDLTATPVHRNGIRAMSVDVAAFDEHTSRKFADIQSLLKHCPLSESIRSTSLRIFEKIAIAESHIHNCTIDDVHFHEVGGIDAIADIVGTVICLDYLGIERVFASQIPLGKGFVTCSHGKLPVPAPATLHILKDIAVYGTDIPYELVTPTGAAIIVTLAERFGTMPAMTIKANGYGAGQRVFEQRPNLLRIITGVQQEIVYDSPGMEMEDSINILETSIDDMNPELFGYLMDRLFANGALDVYWIPVYMKKNRPGTMLQVLCHPGKKDNLIRVILSETTTLGVRYYTSQRRILWRDRFEIKTIYGKIPVKRVKNPNGKIRIVPEYDICERIARERSIPIRDVYDTIVAAGISKEEF
ncbi:MAG: nickel pincer cofactor biosynthesis protein LarC [Desulfobacterales bacterium]|jgi:hypothetical protein